MATTDDNRAALAAAIEHWGACRGASYDCWFDIMTDDIRVTSLLDSPGPTEIPQARVGRDGARAYLDALTGANEMIDWRADTFIAEGDRVVAVGETSWRSRTTGRTFRTPIVMVTRWRDGRMCEYAEYFDTAAVASTMA
ncbi:hypothetical protein HKCCE2091_10770 [Rhodobacterales bacterium HKCCE2091]|nr:hypothetical protein [Rhodobacterales bacterium HKCCE2091]